MEMRCGMPFWRVIATADVATVGASPQVQPPAAIGETFNAAAPGRGNRGVDSFVAFHLYRERDFSKESARLFMQ